MPFTNPSTSKDDLATELQHLSLNGHQVNTQQPHPPRIYIRAGPCPTTAGYTFPIVNDDTGIALHSPGLFTGTLRIRIKHYDPLSDTTATREEEEPGLNDPAPQDRARVAAAAKAYFAGRRRTFSLEVQGHFHEVIGGDELLFGTFLRYPLQRQPNKLLHYLLPLARYIDPAFVCDVRAGQPAQLYSPLLCAMNVMAVAPQVHLKTTRLPMQENLMAVHDNPRGSAASGTFDSGGGGGAQEGTVTKREHKRRVKARRAYFLSGKHRRAFRFLPGQHYATEFYSAHADLPAMQLCLGLPRIDIRRWIGPQPVRYEARSRDGRRLFWFIELGDWHALDAQTQARYRREAAAERASTRQGSR